MGIVYSNTVVFVPPEAEEMGKVSSKMVLFLFPVSNHDQLKTKAEIKERNWKVTTNKHLSVNILQTDSEQRAWLSSCSDLFSGEVRLAVVFPLREHDGENGVGPAAGLVHVGGSYSSAG